MERFLVLAKKKMVNEASDSEEEELRILMHLNKRLARLYRLLFERKGYNNEKELLKAEKAFLAHSQKIKNH